VVSRLLSCAVSRHLLLDCVVPGAGAFEIAVHEALQKLKVTVPGRARLGIQVRWRRRRRMMMMMMMMM
jgi:chaperonin GroEL (HSP60 family)